MAEKQHATIFCPKWNMVDNVKRLARKLGCIIPDPISFNGLKDLDGPLLVDNADWVLSYFMKVPQHQILAISIDGVPEIDYVEYEDVEQWQEFQKFNPDLTYREFATFKYDLEFEEDEYESNV